MHRTLTACGICVGLLGAALPDLARTQQLDCVVKVSYESVSTTHKDLLVDLQSDLANYIRNYTWGLQNTDDKVSCTFDIFVQAATGENTYLAQVFVGSQRPIYGSEQSTAVLRLMDESWEFTYIKSRPIDHQEFVFSDLTSFLDLYVYLVMGYDADTFEKLGGAPYFQKAADIVSLARASGQEGWNEAVGGYGRSKLVREIVSSRYAPVREAIWRYHFAGLDSLAFNRPRALQNIIGALETIGKVRSNADPQNVIVKLFFDTKYQEIAGLFKDYGDPAIYLRFSAIDPNHQQTYEQYRTGRR